jgi:hypothetical protein
MSGGVTIVAEQCAAAAAAIAAWRPLDVFRHANNITRFAKATICNEMDVANATAAIREVVDALEDYISRENVEHGAAAGQAEQADPFSNLRKTLAVAASACSVVGSGVQVVQAKQRIAQTMGLPLNALARKGEPLGCPDRYFEPSVADSPFMHAAFGTTVRKELRTAGARIIVNNSNGGDVPDECVSVNTLKNKVIKFVEDASTASPRAWALSDVRFGVITDITDMRVTVYVNPVGLDPGRFATFGFFAGIRRKDDDGQDLPEAGWYWSASWEAVDTGALPVCVDRDGEPVLLLPS